MYTSDANSIGGSVAAGCSGFGAVPPIMKVSGPDEAVSLANDTEHGLTSSIEATSRSGAMHVVKVLSSRETHVDRESFEAMQGFHAGVRKPGIDGADGKRGVDLRA